MAKRTDKGTFAKGHSGNPAGRPKTPDHIKEMLDRLTPRAVAIMAETLQSDDEKLRFQAAQEILNRSLGKPHQSATLNVNNNTAEAHLAALQELTEMAKRRTPQIEHDPTEIIDLKPLPASPAQPAPAGADE